MADRPFEHAPEEVEVLPLVSAELSAPATLIEEQGTLLETAGETEEEINKIKHTKKHGNAIERKREAHTAEEHTNGQGAELNDSGETIQPEKKPKPRKRKAPVKLARPISETVETVVPAGPVSPAAESVSTPALASVSEQEAEKVAIRSEEPYVTDEETPVPASEEERVVIIDTARAGSEELIEPMAVIEDATVSAPATERRHLVKSAGLVSLGNFGSSAIGMLRQVVVGSLGAQFAGPFIAALAPANNFYQLLVNGAVSGALIPTFNDYSATEKRNDLHRIVFTLVNLVLLITILASIGYTLIAPSFIKVLLPGYTGSEQALALQYSQIIFFSLIALGPFSILLAALYSLKEFGWPAFATAAYHIGIILGAIGVAFFGSHFIGPIALPLGALVGSLGEIALLLPGMRKQKISYMFVLDLKHPALRHIYKLYLPVFLGFIFTTLAVLLDLRLQSLTRDGALTTTAMGLATTLIQFPVGLVAAALSFAVLPTLSEHMRAGDDERFKQTLLLGFRVGLLLMIPAMVGLLALRTPITYLLFAHRNLGISGANFTALALQNYAYQLPFVVLDQLLIFAFYARKNTKTPVVIGVVCIAFYLIIALPFYSNIGMPALAFANTVQNSMHAIILLFLLRKAMGSLHIRTSLPTILKICLAAALMGLVVWGTMALLSHVALFSLDHLIGQLLTVVVAGGLASVVYVGAILLFKVEEINLLKGAILAKLGRR
jgi:putative peptidoglycan lipid II flippase